MVILLRHHNANAKQYSTVENANRFRTTNNHASYELQQQLQQPQSSAWDSVKNAANNFAGGT